MKLNALSKIIIRNSLKAIYATAEDVAIVLTLVWYAPENVIRFKNKEGVHDSMLIQSSSPTG